MRESRLRFVRQLGYPAPASDDLYTALMLQPRVIGCLIVVGVWLQSAWLFLALSAALWLGAVVPTWNVFDAIYNTLIAYARGLPPLGAAPAPRRFAMGMAATLALVIGAALLAGAAIVAWVLEGLFAAAVAVVVFGRFCGPACLYHSLRRRLSAAPEAALTGLHEGC